MSELAITQRAFVLGCRYVPCMEMMIFACGQKTDVQWRAHFKVVVDVRYTQAGLTVACVYLAIVYI